MATATDFLSTYLEPLADELTPGQARKILETKPIEKLITRVHELAEKANSGEITEQERIEYEYYIDVDDIIGLLKTKARTLLADSTT